MNNTNEEKDIKKLNFERDVFISHHSNSSKDMVEKIANELEGKDISCWYAPRDCENDWGEAITKAINHAPIFLVLLNAQSAKSENVKNEINIAHKNFCEHRNQIVPFKIDENFSLDDFMDYYIGRRHIYDGCPQPVEEKITALVNRIKYLMEHSDAADDFCDGTNFISSAITPVVDFVGRKKELEQLDSLLHAHKKIFVSGMGGIGKSELLKQFVAESENKFQAIMWGRYEDSLKKIIIDDDSVRIANFHRNSPDESDDSYFERKLNFIKENGSSEHLLIVDNFDVDSDSDFERVMKLPISIIFTSRNYLDDSSRCYMKLEAFDNMEDLLELFKKCYQKNLAEDDIPVVEYIIESLGRHTLAIKLVAKHMKEQRIRPAKMVSKIKDNPQISNGNVANTICSIFEMSSLSEIEKNIMINLSLVPVEGIDTEVFGERLDLDDYDDINNLCSRNWIHHDSARDYISLHPIIAQIVTEQIGYSDDVCENYVCSVIKLADNAKYIEGKERNTMLKQVERLLQVLPKDSKYYVPFYLASGKLFHAFAKHYKTAEYMDVIAKGDFDLYTKVEAATDVADAYRCMNDNETLLIKADEAWELCKGFAEDDERGCRLKAELRGRYGWYYFNRKEYDKSYNEFNSQLQDVLKYEKDNPERVGWGYFNVAIAEAGMGKIEDAIRDFEKAEEYFLQIKMDFAIAVVNRHMGGLYFQEENYDKAQECFNEALRLFIKSVGEQHNDSALTMHDLAKLYHVQGNDEEARKYEAMAAEYCRNFGYEKIIEDWIF